MRTARFAMALLVVDRQAGEESQLYDPALLRIQLGEGIQGIIDREYIQVGLPR